MIIEVFTRIFVNPEALNRTLDFYTGLLPGKITMRFSYPEADLELAAVSSDKFSVLIIAGSPEQRAPFEDTRLTIKVKHLESAVEALIREKAEQIEPIQQTPVGRKTRFRHPDGTIVEYVDHTQ